MMQMDDERDGGYGGWIAKERRGGSMDVGNKSPGCGAMYIAMSHTTCGSEQGPNALVGRLTTYFY